MKDENVTTYPLRMRIPIFLIGCPVTVMILMIMLPIVMLGIVVGVVWCFIEFLVYGDSKTDKEVTFGETK